MNLHEFLRKIPKAELHVHLTGTVFPKTLQRLSRKHAVKLPSHDRIEDLYDRSEFKSILPMLKIAVSVMRDPEDFALVVYETMREAAENGVRYREIFWNPTDHHEIVGLDYKTVVDSIIGGLQEAEEDFGIKGRLLPSINREESSQLGLEMVQEVLKNRCDEVIGLGMDYLETGHPPEKFWKAYRTAREGGLHLTAHAGEFGEPWRNVETALDLLKCERIDHGYTIIDNPELLKRCAEEQIVFPVVPTNSYYGRTLKPETISKLHPIAKMARRGLCIFPNSDDPPLHHTDPGKAYIDMVEVFGYDLNDIRQFIINSIDGAFVDKSYKKRWRIEWLKEFDILRSKLEITTSLQ